MKFYVVDAFTRELMGGNTAGVVLMDETAPEISKQLMRKTAEELKYNITVFVRRSAEGRLAFKYFSPVDELDLCGHATIAAFTALLEEGWVSDNDSYVYHTPVGPLEAVIKNGFVMIEQGEGRIIRTVSSEIEMSRMYEILGLDYQEVYAEAEGECRKRIFPAIVSTGIPDMMVPVEDEEELNKVDPDYHVLNKMSQDYGAASFHVFTMPSAAEGPHCRNFAPLYGVKEDIATGTSTASLLYYLYENGILSSGQKYVCTQGEKLGRASRISGCVEHREDGPPKILVGGTGRILIKGMIYLE